MLPVVSNPVGLCFLHHRPMHSPFTEDVLLLHHPINRVYFRCILVIDLFFKGGSPIEHNRRMSLIFTAPQSWHLPFFPNLFRLIWFLGMDDRIKVATTGYSIFSRILSSRLQFSCEVHTGGWEFSQTRMKQNRDDDFGSTTDGLVHQTRVEQRLKWQPQNHRLSSVWVVAFFGWVCFAIYSDDDKLSRARLRFSVFAALVCIIRVVPLVSFWLQTSPMVQPLN